MNRANRRGVAAVEAAVCLPVLALITFAAIELTGGIFQEYNAQASVFELAKVALKAKSTCGDVQARAAEILPIHDFTEYTINIDTEPRSVNRDSVEQATGPTSFIIPATGAVPAGLDDIPRGTLMRISLTVDRPRIPGRGLLNSFLNSQLNADSVFVKEF